MITVKDLEYRSVQLPELGFPAEKPVVPEEVFRARLEKLRQGMAGRELDAVVIYADREHYGSFKFYTGVDPRFEEALLFIYQEGDVFCALGNECLNLAETARIPITGVLCQCLSLPNQPMDEFVSVEHTAKQCGIKHGMKIGLVDWKLMSSKHGKDFRAISGMPEYLVTGLAAAAGRREQLVNVTDMLIAAPDGLRCRIGAEAAAELEFGAASASESVLRMLEHVQPGMSEREIVSVIQTWGQPVSCHPYVVGGVNTRRGLISPSDHKVELGDELVVSVGLEGGLTCRHVALARDSSDVKGGEHFMENIAKPYIAACFNWLEMIGIGVSCGDIYTMIQTQFPKEKYGWSLNPGHMIGYEEWMCSPIYEGSEALIQSGMMFQLDIIPTDPEYCTPNVEDGLLIADESLRSRIQKLYPQVYQRMMARRAFAEEQLGLKLKPEVLPLSNCFGCYNPYALQKGMAIAIR